MVGLQKVLEIIAMRMRKRVCEGECASVGERERVCVVCVRQVDIVLTANEFPDHLLVVHPLLVCVYKEIFGPQ